MKSLISICLSIVVSLFLVACGGEESDARKAVKASLKDPDSAKFGSFTMVGEKAACLTVNAKNSMGGYTGNQEAFLTKITTDQWTVMSIDGEFSHEKCIEIQRDAESHRNDK